MKKNKVLTQSDIDAWPVNKYGRKVFGNGCKFVGWCEFGNKCEFGERCEFGAECKFGDGCNFGIDCTFGIRPTFGKRCCFCAPMSYLEYVERTNRRNNIDQMNYNME